MASKKYTKVQITAHRVGKECEEYLVSMLHRGYNILGEWAKSGMGDDVTFAGQGRGSGKFLQDVHGIFLDAADTARSAEAEDALQSAVKDKQGYIRLEFAEHRAKRQEIDSGAILVRREADSDELAYLISVGSVEDNLQNLRDFLDLHGADAIAAFGYQDLAEEFREEWVREHGDVRPTLNETEAWLDGRLDEELEA